MTDPASRLRAGPRAWIGLAVLGLPTMLLALDLSVLYFALPRLSIDLGASGTQQLWITDIYGFVTAGFLVTMGTVGDRIGRRRLLLIGAACFGITSVLAAYSTSATMLIGTRALMGVAGATLMPSTLALITDMFRDPTERTTAIAVWTSFFMVGTAVGPIVGGALLARFWWGSVFLMGVPVMVLLLVTAPFLLPEHRDDSAGRVDVASVGLSLGAMLPLVFAVKQFAREGMATLPLGSAALGIACAVAFVWRQRLLASPLLDLRLFRHRAFSAALVILMLGVATQAGVMLLVTQYLLIAADLSPLRAGWGLMPASVAMIIGCIVTPVAARRIRPSWIIATALVISAGGYVLLANVHGARGPFVVVAGAILVFFGIGPVAVLSQQLIVGSVPARQAGSAAALSETSGDLGIALGVAVFGSVGNAIYSRRLVMAFAELPPDVARLARESIAGAANAARGLPAPIARQLLDRAQDSFIAGLHLASAIGAIVSLGLAIVAVNILSAVPSSGRSAPNTAKTDGESRQNSVSESAAPNALDPHSR